MPFLAGQGDGQARLASTTRREPGQPPPADLMHNHDERISLANLHFALHCLYYIVWRLMAAGQKKLTVKLAARPKFVRARDRAGNFSAWKKARG